jgi:hypothetical protein
MVMTLFQKEQRSIAGDMLLRRGAPARSRNRDTEGSRMLKWSLKMRRLTLRMMVCSTEALMVGDDGKSMDSDEPERKGSSRFR